MVLALADRLRSFGHEMLLVVGTPEPGEGTLEAEARAAGIEVVRIDALRRNPHPFHDARALAALVRLFRGWHPDLIATHMSKAGALGRIAGALVRVPVVHTYHGKGFHVFDSWWKTQLTLTAERLLARLTAGTIVVSDIQAREFAALHVGSDATRRVIHYGLELQPFLEASRATLREELGVGPDMRLVGVVGRVVGIKGQDVFIRAAQQICRDRPNVCFVIVGDGDARVQFQALAKDLGIERAVRFLGWRRDIPEILASLDVVVLPTVLDFEGVPVAVIEALAAGRPVVATNVGGVAEVVHDGETGRLVPPRDPVALAAAIRSLLDEPQAAMAMAKRGQELTKAMFRVDRYVKETADFLTEIVGPSARPPRLTAIEKT